MRDGRQGSVSVLVVRALMAGGAALGIAPPELSERAGISPQLLLDPDARVPANLVIRLWDYLSEVSHDDSFGLWLAEQVSGAPLSIGWWVVLSSPTLGEGLTRALRFQRLLHDAARSELVVSEREVVYRHRIGAPPFRPPRPAIEYGFASIVQLARRATGEPVFPLRVRLQHAPPRDLRRHHALFGPDLVFNAEDDELVFERALLSLPLLTADPALREIVEAHGRALLARLPDETSFAARVRVAVCELLRESRVTIDDVATRLSMPRRTVQRKLQTEGLSFSAVLDEVRRELALRYLGDQRLSVQESAFLLGFSDVSAFHRAFTRWTGESPARFRARR